MSEEYYIPFIWEQKNPETWVQKIMNFESCKTEHITS